MNNTLVYLVTHIKDESESLDDFKIIGVFSSLDEAQLVVGKLRTMPGFSESKDGFNIGPYTLDRSYWADGFVSG